MSDGARYTTQAKADAKHSTLKAVRHLKQHMKHLSLKVISYTLEVIEVEEAAGMVQHHVVRLLRSCTHSHTSHHHPSHSHISHFTLTL
jgi:hypothetical protein